MWPNNKNNEQKIPVDIGNDCRSHGASRHSNIRKLKSGYYRPDIYNYLRIQKRIGVKMERTEL